MLRSTIATVTFAAVLIAAGGCASTAPAPSGQAKAMSVEEISRQYKQGSDLVAQGEAARREAQDKIKAAELEMKDGDALVSRGKTLMAESEQAFRDTSRKTQ
ncbi:MAG: hypothetical protein WA888_18620 [Burkholderiaceae bacterium]